LIPEQQMLFPRLPGEGQGLGRSPKHNKSPGKTRANVLIISGHSQKCLTRVNQKKLGLPIKQP
ncbi:MAG: hypothetical protein K6E27_06085, partial [Eubacterium sp.]|nr:hypothetical protein [Eubacterium sp.]